MLGFDIAGTVYRLVINMQSNKIHRVFLMSLFMTCFTSTCFGPHRSIIRSVLQAVFADLVCGNTHSSTTYHMCKYSLQNALDDGSVRSETCRANTRDE